MAGYSNETILASVPFFKSGSKTSPITFFLCFKKYFFEEDPKTTFLKKKSVVIEKVKFVAEIVITAAARRFQHCFVLELGKDSTLAV